MSPAELEQLLSQIERQCQALAVAVSQGSPDEVCAPSAALQKLAVDTAHFFAAQAPQARTRQADRARLKRVAQSLALQREQLIRRSAVNERALHALVPATGEASYAQLAGPYGGAVRQSGAFKLLRA